MQIFDTAQVKAWDDYTIKNEPVSSLELMERAATACYSWLVNVFKDRNYTIFCGKGNNGGDGLAIARMLSNSGHHVTVYILEFGHKGTDDFQANLASLHETQAQIKFLSTSELISLIPLPDVIVDALIGSGLTRPIDGLTADLVRYINAAGRPVVSIDTPSGLFLDRSSVNNQVVNATYTLSFQCQKLAFLVAENEQFLGAVNILDIGLHPGYLGTTPSRFNITDASYVNSILPARKKFSHKGTFGHGALVAGSKGMMGAAVLCARAFLRSGAGKLTCHIPDAGYQIMQVAAPEAMCKIEPESNDESIHKFDAYDAVGIGPGLGQSERSAMLLARTLASTNKPMVIDADALNILAQNQALIELIPKFSILTPHKKEFDRLFGVSGNDFDYINAAILNASRHDVVIVLKGAYSLVALPSGDAYFNNSGNPGMATGGTGDVLTGMITAFLAQGMPPAEAALAGVYLHGLAGDIAAARISEQALIASDLINCIGDAFIELQNRTIAS